MPRTRRADKNGFWVDSLLCGLIRALQWVLRLTPLRVNLLLAGKAGAVYARLAKRRSLALQNLLSCFGNEKDESELKAIRKASFQNLFMSVTEILNFARCSKKYFDAHVTVEGKDRVDERIRPGRGVLLLAAHMGNWELLTQLGPLLGYETYGLIKVQKYPRLEKLLAGIRSHQGARMITRGDAAREIIAKLKAGAMVGILVDQDAGPNAVTVPFFGRQTSYPEGIGRLARISGASVFPVFNHREGLDRHLIRVGDEIVLQADASSNQDDAHVMRQFSFQLEKAIRQDPKQWLWQHRRWKSSVNRHCLILSDQKKGHIKQAEVFLKTLCEQRGLSGINREFTTSQQIEVKYRNRFCKHLLVAWAFLTWGTLPGGWGLLKALLKKDSFRELSRVYGHYVITCGSGNEAVSLILSRRLWAKTCVIHKPQLGSRNFTVTLVPRHDRPAVSQNVFMTQGALSDPDAKEQGKRCEAFIKKYGQNIGDSHSMRLGLLVGGPSRRSGWDENKFECAKNAIKAFYSVRPFEFFVSTSRRTAPATEEGIRRSFGSWDACRLLLVASKDNPAGAYEGLLAACDLILVTSDSVSMVSEALHASRRVIAFETQLKPDEDPKLLRFLQNIQSEHFRYCKAADLLNEMKAGLKSPGRGYGSLDQSVIRRAASKLLEVA